MFCVASSPPSDHWRYRGPAMTAHGSLDPINKKSLTEGTVQQQQRGSNRCAATLNWPWEEGSGVKGQRDRVFKGEGILTDQPANDRCSLPLSVKAGGSGVLDGKDCGNATLSAALSVSSATCQFQIRTSFCVEPLNLARRILDAKPVLIYSDCLRLCPCKLDEINLQLLSFCFFFRSIFAYIHTHL
jgi:hypothetical protein